MSQILSLAEAADFLGVPERDIIENRLPFTYGHRGEKVKPVIVRNTSPSGIAYYMFDRAQLRAYRDTLREHGEWRADYDINEARLQRGC